MTVASFCADDSGEEEQEKACGTTATVMLVRQDRIVVANVGDSRAVLSRKGQAIDLSTEHRYSSSLLASLTISTSIMCLLTIATTVATLQLRRPDSVSGFTLQFASL